MDDNPELTEHLEKELGPWSANSNECTTIQLLNNDGAATATFQPMFTYTIFDEPELIFGYRELRISLTFAAHDMRPHVSFKYKEIYNPPIKSENVAPHDIKAILSDFFPEAAFVDKPAADALRSTSAANFMPPGEKVRGYKRDGRQFEVWCDSLANPAAREIFQNAEILMQMFIEGASKLDLDYEWTTSRWKVFFLYEYKARSGKESHYSLVGLGTSYRCFTFPDRQHPSEMEKKALETPSEDVDALLKPGKGSPLDLPSRERLSQFLILPSFHRQGHGQELYRTMYNVLATPSNIREFTVEDPNEAFDDLRDLCDLMMLRKRDDFAELKINTKVGSDKLSQDKNIPVDVIVQGEARRKIMQETKMMQRQFDRLVEAHTLSSIPPLHRSRNRITRKMKASNEQDRAYYLWRLYAKYRLYIFNRDQLSQLEGDERVEKLEAALDSVQEGYLALLEKAESLQEEMMDAEPTSVPKRKRPTIEDDEDDDEDEDDLDVSNGNGKKARR